jgi:uncharacterized protein (DUF2147 family)
LFVANSTIDDDYKCRYNLFVCVQPAIGDDIEDKTVEIFNIVSNLTQDSTRQFRCCEDSKVSDLKVDKNYPRSHIFEFETGETRPNFYEILASVDRAMWEVSKLNFDNMALVDRTMSEDVPDKWNEATKVRFNYKPWRTVSYTSTYLKNDDCYSGLLKDGSSSTFLNPKDGPVLIYNSKWNGKFTNTNYDKISMSIVLFYHEEIIKLDTDGDGSKDDVERRELIITPRVTLCRD